MPGGNVRSWSPQLTLTSMEPPPYELSGARAIWDQFSLPPMFEVELLPYKWELCWRREAQFSQLHLSGIKSLKLGPGGGEMIDSFKFFILIGRWFGLSYDEVKSIYWDPHNGGHLSGPTHIINKVSLHLGEPPHHQGILTYTNHNPSTQF